MKKLLFVLGFLSLISCENPVAVNSPSPKVAAPVLSPAGAFFPESQSVTVTGPTGANLYYTLNGTTPTTASGLYTTPLSISQTLTLKVLAVLGSDFSAVTSGTFVRTVGPMTAPVFNPSGTSVTAETLVSLTGPWGASLYYTTDGTTPTSASIPYSSPLLVASTVTLKALAIREGVSSPVSTTSFTWTGGPPISSAFWGRWLGVGNLSNAYISASSVRLAGIPRPHSAVSENSITLSGGTLTLTSEGVLQFLESGSTVPYYLFQNAGATSSFQASLTDSQLESRALSSLGGIKVLIRNKNNPSNQQEVVTDSSGTVQAVETIVGDDYQVIVPSQDEVPEAVETVLTPSFNGQDLGVLDMVNTGANFKVNLRALSRPDLLMADGTTEYSLTVDITNVGKTDVFPSYTLDPQSPLSLSSSTVTGTLGSLPKGESKTLGIKVKCDEITSDFVDAVLNIKMTDPTTGKYWQDRISLRFVKKQETFLIRVRGGAKGVAIDPSGASYPLTDAWENIIFQHTKLIKKPGVWTMVFGGEGTGFETAYGVGIDVAAPSDLENLTSTSVGEPNNSLPQATLLDFGGTAMQFLGAKDVDFYQFTVPLGTASVSTGDLVPGLHIGAKSVVLTPTVEGAQIRYTKDFTLPTKTTGTLWTGETISLLETEALYVHVSKDLYQSQMLRLVERPWMITIPGGIFHNGTAAVGVSSFQMSSTEVTQAQYQSVMGSNPSKWVAPDNPVADQCPVEYVSWYAALVYCNKRSLAEGLTPVYSLKGTKDPDQWGTIPKDSQDALWDAVVMDDTANGYKLPTEAQWEYAYRGGTTSLYFWGHSNEDSVVGNYAWYNGNLNIDINSNMPRTKPVATKLPNPFGLFDMAGNVGEWCWDWSASFSTLVQFDPKGPASGTHRIGRNAIWVSDLTQLMATHRFGQNPGWGYYGFRVVRNL